MYIRTKEGWRPLWTLSQPSLQEVRDRVAWLSGPTLANLAERQAYETTQHLALLTLRQESDEARDKRLNEKTGIKLKAPKKQVH